MSIKTGLMVSGMFCACVAMADTSSSSSSIEKKRDACVWSDQIQGWNVLDSRHVLIWSPTYKTAYLLTLIAPLNDTSITMSLAFVDNDHDGMICGHSSDAVNIPGDVIRTAPSIISDMHRVDDLELQRLSEKYKIDLAPKSKKKKSSSASSSSDSSTST